MQQRRRPRLLRTDGGQGEVGRLERDFGVGRELSVEAEKGSDEAEGPFGGEAAHSRRLLLLLARRHLRSQKGGRRQREGHAETVARRRQQHEEK